MAKAKTMTMSDHPAKTKTKTIFYHILDDLQYLK